MMDMMQMRPPLSGAGELYALIDLIKDPRKFKAKVEDLNGLIDKANKQVKAANTAAKDLVKTEVAASKMMADADALKNSVEDKETALSKKEAILDEKAAELKGLKAEMKKLKAEGAALSVGLDVKEHELKALESKLVKWEKKLGATQHDFNEREKRIAAAMAGH